MILEDRKQVFPWPVAVLLFCLIATMVLATVISARSSQIRWADFEKSQELKALETLQAKEAEGVKIIKISGIDVIEVRKQYINGHDYLIFSDLKLYKSWQITHSTDCPCVSR